MKKKFLKIYCIFTSLLLALTASSCNGEQMDSESTLPSVTLGEVTGNPDSFSQNQAVPEGDVDEIIQGFINESENALSTQQPALPDTQNGTQAENNENTVTESGIRLLGDKIESADSGVDINGTIVTINKAGEYTLYGTLNDGQIIVNTEKTEKVKLVLCGVNITCSTSAPIYVMSCDDVIISLYEGTVNKLTDGTQYVYATVEENEPNAALFSKDDMIINGTGALIVKANYNNGITSKNDLEIQSGTITVVSAHDGIRGKDSVLISGGTVNVQSGGDAIKSNNETETDKGHITINGGIFNISASEDAFQAQTTLTVNNGSFLIKTASGSGNSWGGNPFGNASESSAKALKSSGSIAITGGSFSINSADDAIHSNGDVAVAGGNIEASSGDDGIHADNSLTISGGEIKITKSYEGLEGTNITIKGGTTRVTASDDGINGAGGNDRSSSAGGRPGGWGGMGIGNAEVLISGGYLYIDAGGDGLDSNGSFTMTGGTVLVDGPTNGGNGPLDYDSSFTVNGGILVAAGSSGMAQNASSTSTQCCVLVYTSASANTVFNISDSSGNSVLTYQPSKQYGCVLVSTPNLKKGESYTVSTGGSCTGEKTDGLYISGSYSGSNSGQTYTQSQVVTSVGGSSQGGMAPGGGMGPGMRPGGSKPGRF